MAEITWPWLMFWLFAFSTLGFCIGWAFKGLTVEYRECRWCDAPTVTPNADYCRRHSIELQERLRSEGRG